MIAVLGAGAWGTALAVALCRADRAVRLWGRDEAALAALREGRSPHLPDVALPPLEATADMAEAIDGADAVLLVVPVAATEAVARLVLPLTDAPLVLCGKGLAPDTGETPRETVLRLAPARRVAVLSGPSFAADVARGLPTAVTLGAAEGAFDLARALATPILRVYPNDDVRGVELGGAFKNVVALAVGVCRGLGLGPSAEAALAARGFAELVRLTTTLGGGRDTPGGLSGLGDLMLSCAGPGSRNFRFGEALGRKEGVDGLPLAEGARTAPTAARLSRTHGLDCAVMEGTARLLAGEVDATTLWRELLERPVRAEG